VIKYFDTLYATPANRTIMWPQAYVLAAMMARDDDTNDRTLLVKMFRENKSPPLRGTIKDIKGPNLLNIESNGKQFEITLARTSINGVSKEIQALGRDFLKGLLKTSYGDCSAQEIEPLVYIEYPHEIFGTDGKLTAVVSIFSGSGVCVGSDYIPFAKINDSLMTDKIILNNVMIARGLVKFAPPNDEKWSEGKMSSYNLWSYSDKQAKDKSLYSQGKSTDALVEYVAGSVRGTKSTRH
jgi:hypothetical protein